MSKFQSGFGRRRGIANERFYGDVEDCKKKPPAAPSTPPQPQPAAISPGELRQRIAAVPGNAQEFSSNAF